MTTILLHERTLSRAGFAARIQSLLAVEPTQPVGPNPTIPGNDSAQSASRRGRSDAELLEMLEKNGVIGDA